MLGYDQPADVTIVPLQMGRVKSLCYSQLALCFCIAFVSCSIDYIYFHQEYNKERGRVSYSVYRCANALRIIKTLLWNHHTVLQGKLNRQLGGWALANCLDRLTPATRWEVEHKGSNWFHSLLGQIESFNYPQRVCTVAYGVGYSPSLFIIYSCFHNN